MNAFDIYNNKLYTVNIKYWKKNLTVNIEEQCQ